MKKQKEQHQLDEFEDNCHLWNIVPGGSGNGIVLLRKIVDSIQHDNYSAPNNKLPVISITGSSGVGKEFTARALVNSLAIQDIRICPGRFFENGYYSHQFFTDSFPATAHVITNIEDMRSSAESTLWKYIYNRQCSYYNGTDRTYDNIVFCNGSIVLTANSKDKISDLILKAADYQVELEPLNLDQIEAALHQRLFFCGIEYDGDEVLKAMVHHGGGNIEYAIRFLKHCMMVMKSETADFLDMTIVKKASRISPIPLKKPVPIDDDMPF